MGSIIMERVDIKQVRPNPDNPRFIKGNKFEKLVKSIKEFPQMLDLRPIVVNQDMIVLGGNMRLKACEEAGLKEVPIIFADNLTPEQEKEFIIKDNSSFGEWDWDLLANEWETEQLIDWGMDIPDDWAVDEVLEAEEDNYEAADDIQTDIVLGDLIEIGEHRLLCGDSTDSDQVAKLMNGEKADMVFTDPPYGNGSSGKYGRGQLGVRTTKAVKKIGCSNMKQVIENDKIIVEDFDIINELSTFIIKGNQFEAEQGANDDLVMCIVLMCWAMDQKYFKELTNVNIRANMLKENQTQMENEMAPFGFVDDGINDPEYDEYGSTWKPVKVRDYETDW